MPEEERVAGWPWGCKAGRKGALALASSSGAAQRFCPMTGFDTNE